MGFSAVIPAPNLTEAEDALEAAGYGAGNFVVPLVTGAWNGRATPDAYGMSVGGDVPEFRGAVAALPYASVRDSEGETSGFDQHLAELGLSREPAAAPTDEDGTVR